MTKTQSAPSASTAIFPLLLVNFIGTLGYSIIIPFLVFLVTRFGGNPFIYGILGSTYPLFQLIGAPLLGRWSDQFGRKKILLISQLGTFISWLIFLTALLIPIHYIQAFESGFFGSFHLSWPLIILFIARALDGLTGGNVSVANAYLADISHDDNRKANFGKLSASGNLGFIIGPTLAGLLGATVYQEILPVSLALLIALLGTFVIMLYLPESNCQPLEASPDTSDIRRVLGQEQKDCYRLKDEKKEKLQLNTLLNKPGVAYLLLLNFLIFLGFNVFYTAFPVHASRQLQWTVTQLGLFFSFLSGLLILVQGPILSYLSKKYSDAALIIVGNFILMFNFFLLSFNDTVLVYLAAVFFAFGNGLMWPSFMSRLSLSVDDRYQGYLQGIATSLSSAASIIGLIGGGVVYGILGADTFIIAGLVIFIVALMCLRLPYLKHD